MAKVLIFKLSGTDYGAAPMKIERKKIYGWTDIVATDRSGNVCGSAYLSPDDALIIPSGGLKQATVDETGRWVNKNLRPIVKMVRNNWLCFPLRSMRPST